MALEIRPATGHDLPFLERMLHEALFVPPGIGPLPESVTRSPAIARYVAGFGDRPGDVGFVASLDGRAIGSVWARRWSADDCGYGFVDEETPEAVMAVLPAYRGRGVGTALLRALIDVESRLSLSVDDRSQAVALYERLGFETIVRDEHSLVMLRTG